SVGRQGIRLSQTGTIRRCPGRAGRGFLQERGTDREAPYGGVGIFVRLYLSSFRNGNRPEELISLLADGRRTGVIFNAADLKSASDRQVDLEEELNRLQSIGLEPEEIDLKEWFGKENGLDEHL